MSLFFKNNLMLTVTVIAATSLMAGAVQAWPNSVIGLGGDMTTPPVTIYSQCDPSTYVNHCGIDSSTNICYSYYCNSRGLLGSLQQTDPATDLFCDANCNDIDETVDTNIEETEEPATPPTTPVIE